MLAEYKENEPEDPDDPPTEEQLELKSKAFNQSMALIAFKGADGSVTRKFATDYTLDNDKYPRTLEKLSDTLNSPKWNDTYFEKKKCAQDQSQRNKKGGTEEKVTSFAHHGKKTKQFCYVCGKDDHTSPICADKDKIPRSEWYVNKAHSHMQHSEQADGETEENEESAPAQAERRSGTPSRGRSATPRRGALNQFQRHANTAFQGFIGAPSWKMKHL